MASRINGTAATVTLVLQVAVSISTQSMIAGVIAAAMFVVIVGPTQWEK